MNDINQFNASLVGGEISSSPVTDTLVGEESTLTTEASLNATVPLSSAITQESISIDLANEISTSSMEGVLGGEIASAIDADISALVPRFFSLSENDSNIEANEIRVATILGFIDRGAFNSGESINTNTRYKIEQSNENPFEFSLYSKEIDSDIWVLRDTITLPVVSHIDSHTDEESAPTVGAVKDYVESKRTFYQYPSVSEFPLVGNAECIYVDTSTNIAYYFEPNLTIYKKFMVDVETLDIDYINANFE